MQKLIKLFINLFILFVLGVTAAQAADQRALANVKGCFACHDLNEQKVGPSYKAVAKKYASQKDAKTKLVEKVLEGGTGTWGDTPMPATKTMGVSKSEAGKLVSWILSLK